MNRKLKSILSQCTRAIKKLPKELQQEKNSALNLIAQIPDDIKYEQRRTAAFNKRIQEKFDAIEGYMNTLSPEEQQQVTDFIKRTNHGEAVRVRLRSTVGDYLWVAHPGLMLTVRANLSQITVVKKEIQPGIWLLSLK